MRNRISVALRETAYRARNLFYLQKDVSVFSSCLRLYGEKPLVSLQLLLVDEKNAELFSSTFSTNVLNLYQCVSCMNTAVF